MGCWNTNKHCGIFMVAVKGEDALMDPIERKTAPGLLDEAMVDDVPHDDDEPTTEELVEMLRESVQQANSGQTRPLDEFLRELDEILAENDDAS